MTPFRNGNENGGETQQQRLDEGTYVWQYDCKDGMWTPLALESAGAEFINNYKAVKITHATVLNPDAPTYLQEYRYSHQMINL